MLHEVDRETFRVFREVGLDTDYLLGEDYEVADWKKSDLLKKGFPEDKEISIFTNGNHAVKVVDSGNTVTGTSFSLGQTLEAVMKLKAADPELPVYHVHNHPKAESVLRGRGLSPDSFIWDKEHEMQKVLGGVPSEVDVNSWDKIHNISGGAIYHQDADEIRIWKEGDDRNRFGTRLAIEYDLVKYDSAGFKLDVPEKVPVNVHWATEHEHEPNTEYITPSEWDEKKHEWLPKLDFQHTSAPWTR